MLECRTLLVVRFLCNARIGPEVLTSTLYLHALPISPRLVGATHIPPPIHPLGNSSILNGITDDLVAAVQGPDASSWLRFR
jgi:hypothetical protein